MSDLRRMAARRLAAAPCGLLAASLVACSAHAQGPRGLLEASIETALVEEDLVGATWALVTP